MSFLQDLSGKWSFCRVICHKGFGSLEIILNEFGSSKSPSNHPSYRSPTPLRNFILWIEQEYQHITNPLTQLDNSFPQDGNILRRDKFYFMVSEPRLSCHTSSISNSRAVCEREGVQHCLEVRISKENKKSNKYYLNDI